MKVKALLLIAFGYLFIQSLNAQTYCPSKGNLPWNEWIANVQIGTINNTSQKEGYGNFTSQTTDLAKGTTYPLSITQGFSWAPDPINQTQQGRMWIDYNKNGTFEETELVAAFSRNTITNTIIIPATATLGATRMRIALKTIGFPTPCEVFERGEVEDYTVNITEATTTTNNDILQIISASANPTAVTPGGNAAVTLQVRNNGTTPNSLSKSFLLSDVGSINYPRNTVYSFARASNDVPINTVIAPQETRTVTLNFKIDTGYTHKKTYPLPYFSAPYPDGVFVGLSGINYVPSTELFPVKLAQNITAILPNADLSVAIDAQNTVFTGGDIVYTVKVKNNSAISAREVECSTFSLSSPYINAVLTTSKGRTAVYNSATQTTVVAGYWYVGTLAPNEEATCLVRLTISAANFDSNSGIFRAGVQSLRTNDPTPANDAASVTFTRGTVTLPDLTLANLTIPTPSVEQGKILNFKFDGKNIGNASTTGNFTIKSYLSFDSALTSDDYQDGVISTANYTAGANITQIAGSMTVASTVRTGSYYLLLKIDADNGIVESDETNNVLVSSNLITVTAPTATCPPQYKGFPISNNTPCGNVNVDTLGGLGAFTIYQRTNNPADGFDIVGYNGSLASTSSYVLYLRNGTTTPPAGLPIINCSTGAATNNWLYFTNVTGNVLNNTRGGCYCAPQIVSNGVIQVGIGAHGTGTQGFGVLVSALNGSNLTIPLAIRSYST
jgi:hypothetical protein